MVAAAGLGGLGSLAVVSQRQVQAPIVLSQAGRDQALIWMLKGARRTIYLRSKGLALVPVGNELAQALQRGTTVVVELPLCSATSCLDSRLATMIMELGAVVTFRDDAARQDQGTLLVIDGTRFLYSASPLILSSPGSEVSYVSWTVDRLTLSGE